MFVLCLRPAGLCYAKASLFDKLIQMLMMCDPLSSSPFYSAFLKIADQVQGQNFQGFGRASEAQSP